MAHFRFSSTDSSMYCTSRSVHAAACFSSTSTSGVLEYCTRNRPMPHLWFLERWLSCKLPLHLQLVLRFAAPALLLFALQLVHSLILEAQAIVMLVVGFVRRLILPFEEATALSLVLLRRPHLLQIKMLPVR